MVTSLRQTPGKWVVGAHPNRDYVIPSVGRGILTEPFEMIRIKSQQLPGTGRPTKSGRCQTREQV
jgi:hypothetical protein